MQKKTDHMQYLSDMEVIDSTLLGEVVSQMEAYDYDKYTADDVKRAIACDSIGVENFKALLSPAAAPFLEEIAQKAREETRKHFGNSVYMFTPIYIANYCDNYCIYCGFNSHNKINRAKLSYDEIDREMSEIAKSGLQEILILTGESRKMSDVHYIGEACKIARKYFRLVGVEVYPMNTDEYAYLHKCGADFVTVFQETYNSDKYETLHLAGHKRIFPYRFYAQERAILGGMRGVGFAALLGLDDFRKDAFATGLHAYLLQKKYPHAEIAFSCPRLRPIPPHSRFILGSGKYSLTLIKAAIENAGAQIITLALRRAATGNVANILDYIPKGVTLLPNTSGARNAEEAVRIARLAREVGCGNFIKIECIRDSKYLLPDNAETIKATEILAKEGFIVMPYMYPDLNAARDLKNAGAASIMPLGAPIGSNKGLCTREFIQILIDEIDLPIIVDAGIGRPSQACEAMEMGSAAVMANTAIATAGDVSAMAGAFKSAIEAGRKAYLSGLGRIVEKGASASSPLTGFLEE